MRSPIGQPAEVPCARCERRVAGLAWGERCRDCLAERRRRASRLARRISLVAALLAAIFLGWGTPGTGQSRTWVAIGVLGTFLLTRMIAMRIAMEFLPD